MPVHGLKGLLDLALDVNVLDPFALVGLVVLGGFRLGGIGVRDHVRFGHLAHV